MVYPDKPKPDLHKQGTCTICHSEGCYLTMIELIAPTGETAVDWVCPNCHFRLLKGYGIQDRIERLESHGIIW